MKRINSILQFSVLILCVYLIYIISAAIFNDVVYFRSPQLMKTQLYLCLWFMFVFFVGFFSSHEKIKYLIKNSFFFIISIPYLNIIDYMGWDRYFTDYEIGILRFIPLLRGGFALAYVANWLSLSKVGSLFMSYIIVLISFLYFSSLIFYEVERGVNTGVATFWDSLWWALMDATTVGSNIYAVTGIGKVLSVLLAALGMMMFPIFTVYITNVMEVAMKKDRKDQMQAASDDAQAAATAAKAAAQAAENAANKIMETNSAESNTK